MMTPISPKYIFLFILCSLAFLPLTAQRDSTMISGIVYDYETREALEKASFKHNGEFVDISQDGKFQLYVKPNDTLSVKYLGYKDYIIVIPNNLDAVSYISGIFLNKAEIEASEALILPREYNVESIATFDPKEMQTLLQNAKHNVSVAAYQATQPYEWDAAQNQKFAVAMKDMEVEYKCALAPIQQVGISTSTSIQNPINDAKINKFGEKNLTQFAPITPNEEFYLKSYFEAKITLEKEYNETKKTEDVKE